jgi:hypothetical protein
MIRVIKRILLGSAARLRILTQTSLAEIADTELSVNLASGLKQFALSIVQA